MLTATIDNNTYTAVRPTNNPMVLVDECGLAVMSLAVMTEDGKTFITRRPSDDGFQGVLFESGKPFGFELTSHIDTKIHFFILGGSDKNVPVNKINLLPPGQTINIKADNSNESRQFILSEIVDEKDGVTPMVLKDDEKDGVENAQGTYYYVSVYPESKAGVNFGKCTWTCPDVIVTKKKSYVWGSPSYSPSSPGYSLSPSYSPLSSPRKDFTFGGDSETLAEHLRNLERRQLKRHWPDNQSPSFEPAMTLLADDNNDNNQERVPAFKPAFALAKDTNASKVSHGDKITVKTYKDTTSEFAYDKGNTMTMLGLSIMRSANIQLAKPPSKSDLVEIALGKIGEIHRRENTQQLAQIKKVFSSPDCCICLEEGVDIVFFKCGHACTHRVCAENLDKCPLCRQRIYAKINKN